MTQKPPQSSACRCAALVAFMLAFSAGTALAEQPAPPFIPADAPKTHESAGSTSSATPAAGAGPGAPQLPLPYESWQGRSFGAPKQPPEPDRPLPLVRPREQPRRPFEVTGALAAFLPSCSAGTVDDRGCLTLRPGAGIEVALLHRVTPFFGVGVEGALSGFGRERSGAFSGAGGGARYGGVVARVYFADSGSWDPYVALGLGVGKLHLAAGSGLEREATSGLGARVSGGLDYALGAHLRVGPSASFAHWLAYGEQRCSARVCRDAPTAYGRLLGFATLSVRVSGSFGAAL